MEEDERCTPTSSWSTSTNSNDVFQSTFLHNPIDAHDNMIKTISRSKKKGKKSFPLSPFLACSKFYFSISLCGQGSFILCLHFSSSLNFFCDNKYFYLFLFISFLSSVTINITISLSLSLIEIHLHTYICNFDSTVFLSLSLSLSQ